MRRLVSAAGHALSALAVGAVIFGGELGGGGLAVLLSAAAGGAVGGLAAAPLYGRPGGAGWGWAVLGAVAATGLGAALAGLLAGAIVMANALAGMVFAPVVVAMQLATRPAVALTWAASLGALHLTMRRWLSP